MWVLQYRLRGKVSFRREMGMNRQELKDRAKHTLHSDYWHVIGNYFLVSVIMAVIAWACNLIPVVGGIAYSILLGGPLMVGFAWFALQYARGNGGKPSDLFCAFQTDYGNVLVTMFLTNLFIALWSLLLVVPGIIKFYEYRMVAYLLAENPSLEWKKAQSMSREMMDGHKMDAFILDLSFIGWWILTSLTFGLAGIFYVIPYYNQTYAELYLSLFAAKAGTGAYGAGSGTYGQNGTSFNGGSFNGNGGSGGTTFGGDASSFGRGNGHYTTL